MAQAVDFDDRYKEVPDLDDKAEMAELICRKMAANLTASIHEVGTQTPKGCDRILVVIRNDEGSCVCTHKGYRRKGGIMFAANKCTEIAELGAEPAELWCPHYEDGHTLCQESTGEKTAKGHDRKLVGIKDGERLVCTHKGFDMRGSTHVMRKCNGWTSEAEPPFHRPILSREEHKFKKGGFGITFRGDGWFCVHYAMDTDDKRRIMRTTCMS
jgi:hypothetical protein